MYTFARVKLTNEELRIANIYALTHYQLQMPFLRKRTHLLMSTACIFKVITVRDWNTMLNRIDKKGGRPWKETTYRDGLLDLMKELKPSHWGFLTDF